MRFREKMDGGLSRFRFPRRNAMIRRAATALREPAGQPWFPRENPQAMHEFRGNFMDGLVGVGRRAVRSKVSLSSR